MPVWRLQTSMLSDTPFDKDRLVITPHFNTGSLFQDPQQLCQDLAAGIHTIIVGGGTREIRVTAYDAQGAPPVYPQGEAVVNAGLSPAGKSPRELSMCLSFYGQNNRPRQRGRLYIPVAVLSGSFATEVRPSASLMTEVAKFVPLFTGLGGADVDWCIYSQVDNVPRSVQHWWVDDEWDIQRSRGLAASTRITGDTTEG